MNARPAVTLLLYIAVNFALAAVWHLILFADTLGAAVPFARETPIFPLGVAAMLVQGILLIGIYPRLHHAEPRTRSGLWFGAAAGLFLAAGAIWVDVAKFSFAGPVAYLLIESIYEIGSFALLGLVIAHRYQPQAA